MSWLNRVRKPQPPRKQLLFFAQEDLQNEVFAVIRITWFKGGHVCAVTESKISKYDEEVIAEFSGIVGEALTAGADVSAMSVVSAEELGIEPT
tara:strand:- start:515 stop:793 length:279 start_codon:yes stop_codon:yes gene_type:complete